MQYGFPPVSPAAPAPQHSPSTLIQPLSTLQPSTGDERSHFSQLSFVCSASAALLLLHSVVSAQSQPICLSRDIRPDFCHSPGCWVVAQLPWAPSRTSPLFPPAGPLNYSIKGKIRIDSVGLWLGSIFRVTGGAYSIAAWDRRSC